MHRLLIVIPAFNEEKVIGSVIESLPKKISKIKHVAVLVIDDGSTDTTFFVAHQKKIKILRHIVNRGLGAAIGTGFVFARENNYDLLVTCDADGQHQPQDVKKVIEELVKNNVDVIIGSRLLNSKGMPWPRRLVNVLSNILTFLLFSVWTTDSQSGLRGFNKKAIQGMKIKSQKMEVSSEVFKEINRLKLSFKEIAITSVYTTYSVAKGQRLSNAPNVFWKLLLHKFS